MSLKSKLVLPLLVMAVAGVVGYGLWLRVALPLLGYGGVEQPIAFSHRLHAGEKQIDCQYCHTAARRSISAGMPSVERCMGCHKYIAVRKPEIRKLADYWEKKQPIPWVRIYRLPDFVYFSHKRHILAGLACQPCHGPVQQMDIVYLYPKLEMGWCLSCHEQARTPEELKNPQPSEMALKTRAPLDCATCHK